MTQKTHTALVIGTGGIAQAMVNHLRLQDESLEVIMLGRSTQPSLDFDDETSLVAAAQFVQAHCLASGLPIKLIFIATGYLHTNGIGPERSLTSLDATYLQRVLHVNVIGPALVLKHFSPLLPRTGEVKIAMLTAKVGSISDNALGGWYGYRAAKAGLNQLVKTAAIELSRKNKAIACVALHPGTVATALSEPFSKNYPNVRPAAQAAAELHRVITQITPEQTGGFFDYEGNALPW